LKSGLPANVLHIAPENTAGVPYNAMQMQNMFGMPARLLTLYKIPYNFPEDICLDLPLPKSKLAMKWREYKQSKLHEIIDENNIDKWTHMPYFAPKNMLEKFYRNLREKKNESRFLNALKELNSDSFNIIHFDGGIDYYADSQLAKKWKKEGKKIINCYFGDDLRTRGIVKEMDELSDLNLCFEYDHTFRHPNINFLFFPFDNSSIRYIPDKEYGTTAYSKKKLRIVHSPTHRIIKGTPEVLNAIEKVKKSRDIEFVLLENMPREKVIELKSTCHIAIDQIGNRGGTGYGINSLETLSMGLPTITDMNCGMDTWLPENPFIVANADNLADKLIDLIDNEKLRMNKRSQSRKWVEKYHSYKSVFNKMLEYYKKNDII
jgi:hypothetical protein